jgi:Domain of unknown function (DUF3846)
MTVKALLVPPDSPAQLIDVNPAGPELAKAIGGWLEIIQPHPRASRGGDWHAYMDEEGKPKQLPANYPATALAVFCGWRGSDILVGPILFLGEGATEGDEGDVPQDLITAEAELSAFVGDSPWGDDSDEGDGFSEDRAFRS